MDSRQQFEEWYLERFCGGAERLKKCVNDLEVYYFTGVQSIWVAWQASRESLVVDLGSMTNNGYEGFYPANQIKRALRDSGIRTK